MFLKELIKTLENEFNLNFFIKVALPFSLLIWILWQIIILSRFNSVVLFSWGQVFTDTTILVIPLTVFIIWYNSFNILKRFYAFNISCWHKILWLISILFYIFIFLGLILDIFLKYNYYLIIMCFSYLVWYICYLIWAFDYDSKPSKSKNIEKTRIILSYLFPFIIIIFISSLSVALYWLFNMQYTLLYNNIKIKINNIDYKVEYMNDKYVIYLTWSDIKVAHNNDENEILISNPLKTNIK